VRRRSLPVLGALALALSAAGLVAAPTPARADTGPAVWRVGAASADISPQPYDAARDAAEFPTCSLAVFSGPRHFDLEEPYQDTNGNGRYDITVDPNDPTKTISEPYCDANGNGRRDTVYDSGEVAQEVVSVHDPLLSRAFAVQDPTGGTVLIAEVTSQGLFSDVTGAMRAQAVALGVPASVGITIGATHNESSPDELGLYGAPDTGQSFGGTSGIDDYYEAALEHQTALALWHAYQSLAPGSLSVLETRVPATIHQRLSTTFPTTDDGGGAVAVDPDIRVLRATRTDGTGVFTLLNQADHNQEIGHAPNNGVMSEDWPGYFSRAAGAQLGGLAGFMPSDIGSIEDPVTATPPSPQDHEGTFGQAQATGETLAAFVAAQLPGAVPVPVGPITTVRDVYDTPLESNLFKAAAATGLFGQRPLYTAGQPAPRTGTDLRTEVALVDLGPSTQLVSWPGEAFPSLAERSRWGIEAASCPTRVDPPSPIWDLEATHRFQQGLGGDMLGYLEPPWGWATDPGVITDTCTTDPQTGKDAAGHPHKLESESVGPQSAADAATHLDALVVADGHDPVATTRHGRYLTAAGVVTHDPAQAIAIWLEPSDTATTLTPGTGRIVALPGVTRFGSTPVDAHGRPMDANGHEVAVGDLQTRGFDEVDGSGAVVHRWYVDVYPSLTATSPGPSASASAEPAASLPEAPYALLLPLLGFTLGGVLVLSRRRRAGG